MWEGPFIVQEAQPNGHCILLDPEIGKKTIPINFKYVKNYYAWACVLSIFCFLNIMYAL